MKTISTQDTHPPFLRSACSITNTLDLIGDKWTLLIIRDLYLGKHLYGEMLQSPEGISSNILANRLQRLEQGGLVTKRVYQLKPKRHQYLLTPKGKNLQPILQAMADWGSQYIAETIIFDRKIV